MIEFKKPEMEKWREKDEKFINWLKADGNQKKWGWWTVKEAKQRHRHILQSQVYIVSQGSERITFLLKKKISKVAEFYSIKVGRKFNGCYHDDDFQKR